MKREQAEQIAWNHDGGESTASGRTVLTIQQVIDAIMEAVTIEREACAKVCDDLHYPWRWDDNTSGPAECAAAIRARGNE